MSRTAVRGPKFANFIRDQQGDNPDLHYVNYRSLNRCLQKAIGRHPPPVDTVQFIETVSAEICAVNTSFEEEKLELLGVIVGLRQEVDNRMQACEATENCASQEADDSEESSYQFWQRAKVSLVEVLQGLTRFREFALLNCFAVARIHRRWKTLDLPPDIRQDKNLQLVIERLQADPNEWLQQLRYYDGLEFAELYTMIVSMQEMLAAYEQGTARSTTSAAEMQSSAEASIQCVVCLEPFLRPRDASSISEDTEAHADPQFSCGHWVCQTCFDLGRTCHTEMTCEWSAIPDAPDLTTCAICMHPGMFASGEPPGLRSFRGILCQFLCNLFPPSGKGSDEAHQLRVDAEQQEADIVDTTTPLCSKGLLVLAAK